MNDIKEGVRAYLERESGIHAVCAPARHTGEYPLLTVDAQEDGAVLCAGDRERSDKNGRLAALVPVLLRGIPMALPSGVPGGGKVRRVLSPQGLETEGDELRFTLSLTRSVPPKADGGGAGSETMQVLHWNESN